MNKIHTDNFIFAGYYNFLYLCPQIGEKGLPNRQ